VTIGACYERVDKPIDGVTVSVTNLAVIGHVTDHCKDGQQPNPWTGETTRGTMRGTIRGTMRGTNGVRPKPRYLGAALSRRFRFAV